MPGGDGAEQLLDIEGIRARQRTDGGGYSHNSIAGCSSDGPIGKRSTVLVQSADDPMQMRWIKLPIVAVGSLALLSLASPSDAAGLSASKQVLAVGFERIYDQADPNVRFLVYTAGYTIAIHRDGSA